MRGWRWGCDAGVLWAVTMRRWVKGREEGESGLHGKVRPLAYISNLTQSPGEPQRSSATWSRPCASHTNAQQHSHSNTPRTYRDDTYMPDVRHAQTIDEHASTPISDDRTPPNFRAHCACLHRAHGRTTITTFASWSLAKVAPPS